jgi:2',3'-cyclic-nucleotide 2'-phosphodiesterase (5'-nucleotidase family)
VRKNSFQPGLLILVLFIGFWSCSLVSLQKSADSIPEELVLIHWNDFHAANRPYQPSYDDSLAGWVGGYATLAGYVDSLRRLYPQHLVLNAGDDFQGTPVSAVTKGMSQILILNQILPDAFTPGNHEFDYGLEELRQEIAAARFNVISANLYDSTHQGLWLPPYVIIEIGGLKIGVIGYIFEGLESSVLPSNMRGLRALNPTAQIMHYVPQLDAETDLIVALGHNGFEEDSLLALMLDKVDIIIGGHSHTRLRQPVVVNNILICQAGSRGRYLGVLKASVDKQTKSIADYQYELLETRVAGITPEPGVARLIDSLENKIEAEMDEVIGELKTGWQRGDRGESNIGNWITDAMRSYYQADIAFQNSGGIRRAQNPGPLTVRDIWEIAPFDNVMVILEVSGRQLRQLLQWRIDYPRDLLQVSGLKIVYSSSRKQLIEALVNGKPIRDDAVYTIVTNNYVTGHLERFFGLKPEEVKLEITDRLHRDLLIDVVRQQKVIDSRIEGRLVDIDRTSE